LGAAALVLGIILFVMLVAYAPDAVPYSPNNYGWNGIESVSAHYAFHPISSNYGALSKNKSSVLLVVAPVSNFTSAQANLTLSFVKGGGTLVIADSYGFSNSLLAQMGTGIQIHAGIGIYDDLYNWKAPSLPTALTTTAASIQYSAQVVHVKGIALNAPSPIQFSATKAVALAVTSPYSFESLRNDSNPSASAFARGPFTVGVIEKLGNGTIVVIGDSQFFTNPMVAVADNGVLNSNLFSNSTVYLDTAHWPPNTSAAIKAGISATYSLMSEPGLRYILTLVFIGAIFGVMPAFAIFARSEGQVKTVREDSRMYEPKYLQQIRKDRERFGIPDQAV
jgi:hypothetical protein